jgi:hypothetical protein
VCLAADEVRGAGVGVPLLAIYRLSSSGEERIGLPSPSISNSSSSAGGGGGPYTGAVV